MLKSSGFCVINALHNFVIFNTHSVKKNLIITLQYRRIPSSMPDFVSILRNLP